MKQKIIIFVILALCLASCADRKPNIYTGDATVVEISEPQIVSIFDISDQVGLVKLDAFYKEALIGSINKIRVHRGKIYIMDANKARKMFVFDSSGRHIKTFGQIGRGPNEYLELTDFEIDYVNDELIVGDRLGKNLFFYDLDGNFKRVQSVEWPIEQLAIFPNGNIVRGGTFMTGNYSYKSEAHPYLISIFDPSGRNELNRFVKSDVQVKYLLETRNCLASDFDGNITFGTQGDDIIYSVTMEGCTPKYILDWKVPHLESSKFKRYDQGVDFLTSTNSTKETYFLGSHIESPYFLCLSLDFNERTYVLYSKADQASRSFKLDLAFRNIGHFDEDGTCWFIMNSMPVIRFMSSDKALVELLDEHNITDEDIILCKLKFKKFGNP